MATRTGSGCDPLKTKEVDPDRPVGTDWTKVVRRLLDDGAKQAQAQLDAQDDVGDGEVVVHVAMSAFIHYPHKGKTLADEGLVRCVCTNDGEVCVCIGQCDFDACCDPPDAGPIVA
jgi:hypothetical protein